MCFATPINEGKMDWKETLGPIDSFVSLFYVFDFFYWEFSSVIGHSCGVSIVGNLVLCLRHCNRQYHFSPSQKHNRHHHNITYSSLCTTAKHWCQEQVRVSCVERSMRCSSEFMHFLHHYTTEPPMSSAWAHTVCGSSLKVLIDEIFRISFPT